MLVSWASSIPVQQVRLFALQSQFGTQGGANDAEAQCFEGLRYRVVNGSNVNYNIVNASLAYDSRFAFGGVPGLAYGAGTATSALSWGLSSGATSLRDATMRCPAGVTGATLPASFKVVILGGAIPAASLNNAMSAATAPNADNVGTHWIMLPDRGVCVGDAALEAQNNGSYLQYTQTAPCLTGCFANAGAPVFANPASKFRDAPAQGAASFGVRDAQPAAVDHAQWYGAPFGG